MKVTWVFAWFFQGSIRTWATCGTLIFWEYRLPFRTSMGRQMPGNGIDERLLFSFFPLWFPFFFTKFPAATARWPREHRPMATWPPLDGRWQCAENKRKKATTKWVSFLAEWTQSECTKNAAVGWKPLRRYLCSLDICFVATLLQAFEALIT